MEVIKEQWRVIAQFPNYEISNYGQVRRVWKYHTHLKKTRLNKYGYEIVNLSKDGINKHCPIHRLVDMAFINNPNNLPEINHIDGNKENNRVDNLEWVSRSENMKHAYSIGHGRWK